MQTNTINKKGYLNPVIIIIAVAVVIGVYGGFTATSINLDLDDVETCTASPDGSHLICTFDGQRSSTDGGTLRFNIATLSDSYSSFVPIFAKNYPEYSDFFNKNTYCEQTSNDPLLVANVKPDLKDISSYFELREISGSTDRRACGSPAYRVNLPGFLSDKFSPGVVIMEGATSTERGREGMALASDPFKVIGECKISGGYIECKIDDLFKYETARIDSVKLYLKKDGLNINNFCPEYGSQKCVGNEVYSCSGNTYSSLGKIDGKCGYETPKQVTTEPVTNTPDVTADANTDSNDSQQSDNIFTKIINWFKELFK